MTMEPNHHPDDERLAAFAAGEPDVELRLHLRDCARCRAAVDELTMLSAALAELPDLAPSRPLQLLPPVAEPVPSAADRLAGWTRRAFMPLLAAGFGLAIIGSVGTIGPTFNFGLAGAAPASALLTQDSGASGAPAAAAEIPTPSANSDSKGSGIAGQVATASPAQERVGAASASAAAEPQAAPFREAPAEPPRSLWPMILFGGVALIVATLLLRWVVQPRAG